MSADASANLVATLTREIATLLSSQIQEKLPAFLDRQLAGLSPTTVDTRTRRCPFCPGVTSRPNPKIARRIVFSTGTPSLEVAPQLGKALEDLKNAGTG